MFQHIHTTLSAFSFYPEEHVCLMQRPGGFHKVGRIVEGRRQHPANSTPLFVQISTMGSFVYR